MKRIIPILVAGIITAITIYVAHMKPIRAAPEPTQNIPEYNELAHSKPEYTVGELETLAIIIYQEAGADSIPDYIREYVGCVVLNRVEDPNFPNTIQGVATQERQWGCLHWTGIKWPDRASLPVEAHAVERARACAKKLLEADTRSVPGNVIWCAEFPQGSGTWLYSDGIYFCY
jgi:hypothetical protein